MNTTVDQLETPQVLIDRERLLANIDRVQKIADRNRVRLRPHIKTHKCIQLAELQLARGAVGITVSKPEEALVFIEHADLASVTVAYPLIAPQKIERLIAAAAERGLEVRVVVDSELALNTAAAAARAFGGKLPVFLEIDVGLHRCGLEESDPRLLQLAQQIVAAPNLQFAGILSHAGHAYGARDRAEVARVAAAECATLNRVAATLRANRFDVLEVSVGSTPTVLASETFDGVTEIRPGNYVFLDATAVRLGIAQLEDVALSVLATIVSANSRFWIIDAGSKILSSDLGAHGSSGNSGYGIALPLHNSSATPLKVSRLSEEHGWIARTNAPLRIGDRIRLVPNHSCPVANLVDQLTVVSGNDVIDQWPVAARGKVR